MVNFLSQINISKLFQVKYIFESVSAASGLYQYLAIIFGLFIVLAIVFTFLFRKPKYPAYRHFRSSLFNFFLTCGLIGLGLIGLRFEQIPFIGSRLVFLLLLLVIIIWGGWIVYFKIFIMSKIIYKQEEKEKFNKYLPRRVKAGLPKTERK